MTHKPPVTPRFNKASAQSARDAQIKERVAQAMSRMAERFERNEKQLVDRRYAELLAKQAAIPEFKPSFAADDPVKRLRKMARYQVRHEHQARLSKIARAGNQMMGKGNEGLER
jgi:hypothetical protein